MGSVFGRYLKISTFGESHGIGVGVVVDGVPAGVDLTEEVIQAELDKRRPGSGRYVSQRRETDQVEILSGISNGKTIGAPIAMLVRNTDQRSRDYAPLKELFRPGHADYTYFMKYGIDPQPGGGRSSGRETVGRVAAGAVAKSLLGQIGITIDSYTIQIGKVRSTKIDREFARTHSLRCSDPNVSVAMEGEVDKAMLDGDSIGGVIELLANGVPCGWGDPVFDKLDACLAGALLSIGGVKGIEFGDGFRSAELRGSEHNDQITTDGFLSNHAGGILGGISTGQPIVMRLAIKPTASISVNQRTVDIHGCDRSISVKGRHDPCLCPRIAPVAESMTALVLADAWLANSTAKGISK